MRVKETLSEENVELAQQWHPTKNKGLTPENVSPSSKHKAWWVCRLGHEWEASIQNRHRLGVGCPYCSNKKVWKGYNDLQTVNPRLATDWHPTKNGDVLPSDVLFGSTLVAFWQCERGHEWEQQIRVRNKGSLKCPVCTNKKTVKGVNDLKTVNPKLAKEWNKSKNGSLTPYDVSYGSNKKVWWECIKGHEWEVAISTRVHQGTGCPFCSNQKLLKGYNDLETRDPLIASMWHPTKNGDLKPQDVTFGGNTLIHWVCPEGHEFTKTISSMYRRTSLCPTCNSKIRTSFQEQAISYYMSKIFKKVEGHAIINNMEVDVYIHDFNIAIEYDGEYWHKDKHQKDYDKNFFLSDYTFIRVREEGLPELKEYNCHNIFTDASYTGMDDAIKGIFKYIISLGIEIKEPSISCERDKLSILTHMKEKRRNNSLSEKHPNLSKEWHPIKNGYLKPSHITPWSAIEVWWRCNRGHEWSTEVRSRVSKLTGCPYCANRLVVKGFNDLQTTNPKIAEEWHPDKNGDLKPSDVVEGGKRSVWWMCKTGHEWEETLANRKARKTKCRKCEDKVTVYSKLIYNTNLVGVRILLNNHLVDLSLREIDVNNIRLDLTEVKEEYMKDFAGKLLTELEYLHHRTVHDISDSEKDIRKVIKHIKQIKE